MRNIASLIYSHDSQRGVFVLLMNECVNDE